MPARHGWQPLFGGTMKSLSAGRLLAAGAALALAFVAWVNFAPEQLGGTVSYVITYGNSMEPRFHQDDLVIVRDTGPYKTGDVIAYRSEALQQPVMHRIVDVGASGYVTKGDNNSWTDTDRPTDADVIGKEWVHVPGAGKVLKWVADPRGAVLLATAMAALLFAGERKSKHRSERVNKELAMKPIDMTTIAGLSLPRQATLAFVSMLALFCFLLGILSFPKDPVESRSEESAYEHTGRFDYSADAKKSVVYPDGQLSTGGPLFLKLIGDVRVDFDYKLSSEVPTNISGIARLRARLNGSNGWQQTFPLQPPTPFEGTTIHLSGSFDPQEIVNMTTNVQSLTGVPDSFTFSVVPVIEIEGEIGDQPISESFSPTLAFAVDGLQLKSPAAAPGEAGGEVADPLEPTLAGSIKTSQLDVNRVSLLMIDLPVAASRKLSVLGLGMSLLLMFLLWQRFSRVATQDESEQIQAEYGDWLVDVMKVEPSMRTRAVEVANMEALVRLAERYERVILHHGSPPRHDYYVEESGTVYRHSIGEDGEASTAKADLRPASRRTQLRERRHLQDRARLREELQALENAIEETEATGTTEW